MIFRDLGVVSLLAPPWYLSIHEPNRALSDDGRRAIYETDVGTSYGDGMVSSSLRTCFRVTNVNV